MPQNFCYVVTSLAASDSRSHEDEIIRWFRQGIQVVRPSWDRYGGHSTKTIQFPPYHSVSFPFLATPTDAQTQRLHQAIQGIQKLWNHQERLIEILQRLKSMVERRALRHQGNREHALEFIRLEYEKLHGFGAVFEPPHFADVRQWNEWMKQRRPFREVQASHSLAYYPDSPSLDGRNVHRDQLLLVMLAMEARPQDFGGGSLPLASEVFAYLADEDFIQYFPIPDSLQDLLQGTKSAWYYHFDHVGTGDVRTANLANPFYFNLVFRKFLSISEPNAPPLYSTEYAN